MREIHVSPPKTKDFVPPHAREDSKEHYVPKPAVP
jgi:hypothetical protein